MGVDAEYLVVAPKEVSKEVEEALRKITKWDYRPRRIEPVLLEAGPMMGLVFFRVSSYSRYLHLEEVFEKGYRLPDSQELERFKNRYERLITEFRSIRDLVEKTPGLRVFCTSDLAQPDSIELLSLAAEGEDISKWLEASQEITGPWVMTLEEKVEGLLKDA